LQDRLHAEYITTYEKVLGALEQRNKLLVEQIEGRGRHCSG